MSDTMTKTTTVHILTINHKYGTNISVFCSADGARRALVAWAREWYPEESRHMTGVDDISLTEFNSLPDNIAIRHYFEFMEGRESYCLDEVELED
jgi:hypothetical protein